MLRLSNLSIGTKLIITSALGILLMAGMITTVMMGNTSVRGAVDETTMQSAFPCAAATRGVRSAVWKSACVTCACRSRWTLRRSRWIFSMTGRKPRTALSTSCSNLNAKDNQERMTKVKTLTDKYAAEIEKIAGMNAEIFSLQGQRMGATTTEARDLSEHIGDLDSEANRMMREEAAPMAAEIEKLIAEVVTISDERESQVVAAQKQTLSSTEQYRARGRHRGGADPDRLGRLRLVRDRAADAQDGHVLTTLSKDHNIEVPYTTRGDEVGDNARAAQTFKEGLIRMGQMEAEQKAAEKLSAEERRVAMQKLTDDFEAAIGGIVTAAVVGDFSKRVALEGKEGFILNIGGAMNELCENVATTMEDLAQMFGALAEGDFSRRITADYQGIFGVLKNDANSMADRIASTISEIKAVGREVANAAAEISTSTTDLSQRTEEQAASLEQTSASMEEMSATVKKNAENAMQANQLTSGSRDTADRGGQVVAKAVDAMARIEDPRARSPTSSG